MKIAPSEEQRPPSRLPAFFNVPLSPDCYDWYTEMLVKQPVYFDTVRDAWLVFRYEDILRVLRDPSTFSSQVYHSDEENVGANILFMDPPQHRQMRALVSQAFTPRAIAQLEPRIIEIVNELLDPVIDKGTMDVIEDLAFPLPATVIAELLGVPTTDRNIFRYWVDMVISSDPQTSFLGSQAIAKYCQEIISNPHRRTEEDLLSLLLAAEVEGERLAARDVIAFFLILLIAGHETTTNLLGNALVCLTNHSEALQALYEQPKLIPNAIEEVLRYRSPVHIQFRIATSDTVLGGQTIKAGQFVLPMMAAAGLDASHYPNPAVFDIYRPASQHLGFGYGIHFCLGAPLARLESRIAIGIMLERLPNIARISSVPLEIKHNMSIYSLKHVPITFGEAASSARSGKDVPDAHAGR